MAIPYEKICEEDLNLGSGTVDVTMPAGGTAVGHKIGLHSFGFWLNAQDFIDAAGGDDTVGLQAALDASKAANGVPVWFPGRATPYVVRQTLTWITGIDSVAGPILIGAGQFATVFDNRVSNGPMLRIDQTAPLKFQRGGSVQGFTIMTTTHPAASDGIYLSALYQSLFQDIRINGLSGTGVVIDIQLGDSDGPVHLTFDRVWLEHCAGYGLNVTQANAASENSFLVMRSCFMQYNTLGGVRYRGLIATFLDCAFVRNSPASQGVGGLCVYATPSGSSRQVKVWGCDFEGNGVYQMDIQSCANASVICCEFLHNAQDIAGNPVLAGIRLGGTAGAGQTAINVDIFGCVVRNYTPGYIQFQLSAAAQYCRITNTRWDVFDEATQTRFADAGLHTHIEDDGFEWPTSWSNLSTTLVAPGSYTPDLQKYNAHRVNITAPGNYSINNPTTGTQGGTVARWFALDIFNNSGGAILVTFGGFMTVRGYSNPAPGSHRTVLFYLDAGAQWRQIGGWNVSNIVVQTGPGTDPEDTFSVWTAAMAAPALFVAGQDIGFGTATPGKPLDLQRSLAAATLVARVYNPSATVGAGAALWLGTDASNGAGEITAYGALHATKPNVLEILNFPTADIRFNIAGSQLIYIKPTGRLGIAKALPGTPLAVLGLPTFADNAAALAGALTAGDFYKTATGVLMVVF